MIEVTRLNGIPILLNSDLIKTAESSPDTMLTLITGEKLIVRETCPEIVDKVLAYRALLLAAVAARSRNSGDLPRMAALTSLNVAAEAEAHGDEESIQPALHSTHGSQPVARLRIESR